MAKNDERKLRRNSYLYILIMNNSNSRHQRIQPVRLVIAGIIALTVMGCNAEDIKVYTVPKEKPAMPQHAMPATSLPPDHPPMNGTLPADHPPIDGGAMPGMQAQQDNPGLPKWTVPETWKQEPTTQMLLAKFSATKDGARANISVSSFPGDVGGPVANVNRWRGQIGLPVEDEAAAKAELKDFSVGSEKGSLVDLEGSNASGQKVRLVGVMLPHGEQTWFFKMLGDANVVADQKDAFVKFVQSVKF
jgi:hypothetical protein